MAIDLIVKIEKASYYSDCEREGKRERNAIAKNDNCFVTILE